MANLKNILRCYAMGMGIRSISEAFRVSSNTVRKYVHKYQESGLPIEKVLSLSEGHIQEMFVGGHSPNRTPSRRREELYALLPDYSKRLRHKGVTAKSLYAEYIKTHPDGYCKSGFNRALRQYTLQTRVVGHVEHLAGDQMYVEFARDRLEIVDAFTGETRSVEVFVAILPCSHYTYCESVWSQRKEDLITACENAIHFYGGAPMCIVPDNLKSAVTKSDRNDPVIKEEFAAFAEHYNCAVLPARVRHPKDKALVENAVKLMYRSVYADIEGMVFNDLKSLNEAVRISLESFNRRKMAGRRQSRLELFMESEADYLRPLPTERYQMRSKKTATVMRNSYVTLNKHHYSVPTEYVGKRVDIIYDKENLEIYHGLRLVTTHHRDDTPYAYTQKPSHNLPGRRGSYEQDLGELFRRAAQIDNIILLYLKELTSRRKYPPLAFRVCRGVMSLGDKYGLDRLVAVCAYATQAKLYTYQELCDVLERGDDAAFLPDNMDDIPGQASPVKHKNIRGRDYYSKQTTKTTKTKEHGNK